MIPAGNMLEVLIAFIAPSSRMISPFEEEYPVINQRFLDSFSDSLAKNFVPILSPETILLITFFSKPEAINISVPELTEILAA